LLNRALRLPIGLTGLAVLIVVGIGGQAVWLLYAGDEVALPDALAIEGVIVAVVSGVLALNVALRHETDLKEVSQTLDGVTHSILTRTIGPFPDFIPHITAMLGQAKESIMVMCDNPAYGIVSKGDAFDDYLAELKRQIARRVSDPAFAVELMFLGDRERQELHLDQVKRQADPGKWEAWRDESDTRERLTEFLKRAHGVRAPGAKAISDEEISTAIDDMDSVDRYVDCLVEVNRAILDHHLYGAKKYVLELRDGAGQARARALGPTTYFWMRDCKHAIFAIVPLGDVPTHSREIAFETHDPTLIAALQGIFYRYKDAAGRDVTQ
jgi:hypothetical protein